MIALDAQLAVGTPTGVGVYVRGLLDAFAAEGFAVRALREPRLDPWRFDRRVAWDQGLLPLRARGAALLHCAAGTAPLLRRGATVVTVHDMAWLRVQGHAPPYARAYFGAGMLERYRRATRIVAVSAFARDELLATTRVDPAAATVVHNGVDPRFAALRRAPDLDAPRILAVGTVERRKNLAVAIRALARMRRRDARLIAPGPATPYRVECERLARELGVEGRVDFAGYLDDDALLAEYARAAYAVAPSRYEGFGYGAAQALVAGVPLLVADRASLPEIAGPDVEALDPDDADAWAERGDALLEAYDARAAAAEAARAAAAARFDWRVAARRTREVYAAALGG